VLSSFLTSTLDGGEWSDLRLRRPNPANPLRVPIKQEAVRVPEQTGRFRKQRNIYPCQNSDHELSDFSP